MLTEAIPVEATEIDELTGKLVLLIPENRPWHQVDQMHRELGEKVRAYVRYLRSPDFADEYDLGPSDAIVRLVSTEAPVEETLQLFDRIRYELAKHSIEFEVTVATDTMSPAPLSGPPGASLSTKQATVSSDALMEVPRSGNGNPATLARPTATVPETSPVSPGARNERVAEPITIVESHEHHSPTDVATVVPVRTRRAAVTRIALLIAWLAVAGTATLSGLEYYLTPIQERPYSELHGMFKPNGTVGLWFGIIGTMMIAVGTAMYSLRKRVRFLGRAGRLTVWLQFHIFLCTLGPYLVVLHTTFKVGGVVSIAFWSMIAVVASGFLGRYLYIHIPRNLISRRDLLRHVHDQQEAIIKEAQANGRLGSGSLEQVFALGRQREARGLLHALFLGIRNDLGKRSLRRKIEGRLESLGMPAGPRRQTAALMLRQVELQRQVALLAPFQKMFAYWHVAHLPMSTVMALVVILHIVVAVVFGYASISN